MTVLAPATIDAAMAARTRLAGRPVRATAEALAEAARRWCRDPDLARALPGAASLTPAMVRAVLPLVAEAIDADALVDLHAREATHAAGPALVAVVVASNVPALAVPAIVHACLAGAAVIVKSGRADTVSAAAFRRALADADPALAATVVDAYWPGGADPAGEAVLARADVVVVTGTDATVAALARRHGARVVGYGDRTSVAVVAADASDETLRELARDVARYEQRGCLSPHAVFTAGDPRRLGERLLAALDVVADELPAPAAAAEARAAHRLAIENASFAGADVLAGRGGGTVLVEERANVEPVGGRTVRLHGLADPREIVRLLPAGRIECVGVASDAPLDVEALRARGVSRICPVGRMQRPRIDWPRGQRPPLASLFRARGEPRIQVEP